ncbi:MAG TPA: hypothetical protein VIH61_00540, partial [Waddliaceae bacterium]
KLTIYSLGKPKQNEKHERSTTHPDQNIFALFLFQFQYFVLRPCTNNSQGGANAWNQHFDYYLLILTLLGT